VVSSRQLWSHWPRNSHVVEGVLEDVLDDAPAVARFRRSRQAPQLREEFAVGEGEQLVAGDAFGVGGPGAPAQRLGDRRPVAGLEQFQFAVLVVDDLEEEHPAQLADALGVAVDATVLAHDVLDGLDEGANGYGARSDPTGNFPESERHRASGPSVRSAAVVPVS